MFTPDDGAKNPASSASPAPSQGGDALLFVDVDGVLNSRYTVRRNRELHPQSKHWVPYDEPDKAMCQLIKLLLDSTSTDGHPTRCVLTSTWRLKAKYLARAVARLSEVGVELYGVTVSLPCLTRVDEILEFVERYNREHKEPTRVRVYLRQTACLMRITCRLDDCYVTFCIVVGLARHRRHALAGHFSGAADVRIVPRMTVRIHFFLSGFHVFGR